MQQTAPIDGVPTWLVHTPTGPVAVGAQTEAEALRIARGVHERDVWAAEYLDAMDLRPPPPEALVALHTERHRRRRHVAEGQWCYGPPCWRCELYRERWRRS